MIIDCFLFYNELDILELRLETLRTSVDRFILVRGDRTFRGATIEATTADDRIRPLTSRFALDICTVELPAIASSAWDREYLQRTSMRDAIAAILTPPDDATILLSDVDEIPAPENVVQARSLTRRGEIVCFQQIHSYFALNLVDAEPWFGTRATSWSAMNETSAHDIRDVCSPLGQALIVEGGWHFGWTGGTKAIREKLHAFSHKELDTPEVTSDDNLERCIAQRVTAHNNHKLEKISLDLLPPCVRAQPDRFRHLLV